MRATYSDVTELPITINFSSWLKLNQLAEKINNKEYRIVGSGKNLEFNNLQFIPYPAFFAFGEFNAEQLDILSNADYILKLEISSSGATGNNSIPLYVQLSVPEFTQLLSNVMDAKRRNIPLLYRIVIYKVSATKLVISFLTGFGG